MLSGTKHNKQVSLLLCFNIHSLGTLACAGSHSIVPSAKPKAAAQRKSKAPTKIDKHIAAASKATKEAQTQVTAARTQARNERKKRQWLIKQSINALI